jgi:hypothetical protein
MLYQRKEALVNRAPSTHDPKWTARERTKPAIAERQKFSALKLLRAGLT